jgi:hypothetical protein
MLGVLVLKDVLESSSKSKKDVLASDSTYVSVAKQRDPSAFKTQPHVYAASSYQPEYNVSAPKPYVPQPYVPPVSMSQPVYNIPFKPNSIDPRTAVNNLDPAMIGQMLSQLLKK